MEPGATGARDAAGACRGFDERKLEAFSFKAAFFAWLFSYSVFRWWMALLRAFTPVFRVPFLGWKSCCATTRFARCSAGSRVSRSVGLEDGAVHRRRAGRRPQFVLGMARDETYRLSYKQLAEAFPLSDVKNHVIRLSREAAEKIVAQVGQKDKPEFDAVDELVTAVPTELCESYYGIRIGDDDPNKDREKKRQFAKWTLAISSYLFGPPFDRPAGPPSESEQLALAAAACLRDTIRASIKEAKAAKGSERSGIVLPR